MGHRARWCVVVVLAGAALGGSTPVLAGEAEELRALKEEIAAERAALAKEREELRDQRQRVDDALTRIEDIEAERALVAKIDGATPSVAAAGGDAEGPRIDVYGFAMLDAIYDFDRVDPNWKSSLRPSKIPVNCPGDAGCGNDGETILSVKQSRLGFKGYFPTRFGEMKTIFEFELYGTGVDEGQTTFRLRHAWGELGQIGAGQTWSLFMDPDVFPNTIEYWGPPGMVFFRNAQVRWSPDLPDRRRALDVQDGDRGAGLGLGLGEGAGARSRLRRLELEQLPRLDRPAALRRTSGATCSSRRSSAASAWKRPCRTAASTGRASSAGASTWPACSTWAGSSPRSKATRSSSRSRTATASPTT